MDKTGLRPVRRTLAAFGAILFVFALGIAGTCDYEEAVIGSMSHEAYNQIVEKVGTSESKIVKEYMSNKSYYDSLP